jgi:hypothetical protein
MESNSPLAFTNTKAELFDVCLPASEIKKNLSYLNKSYIDQG